MDHPHRTFTLKGMGVTELFHTVSQLNKVPKERYEILKICEVNMWLAPRPDGTYIYPPKVGGQVIKNKMEAGTHSIKPKLRVHLSVLSGFWSQSGWSSF